MVQIIQVGLIYFTTIPEKMQFIPYNSGMPSSPYVFRECTRPTCQFRFPVEKANRHGRLCPKCGAETVVIPAPESFTPSGSEIPWNGLVLDGLLDNIRSTFNVGSIFRSADGSGFHLLHLCGITPTPDHPKVGKTALGAEQALPWVYYNNSLHAAGQLKEQRACLWALEQTPRSISLFDLSRDDLPPYLVLIAGNEIAGVDPGLLDLCDRHVWIPMQGQKESLNVAIAFSIAAYLIRYASR